MSLKKKLRALAKLAKGSIYGVKLGRLSHATDGVLLITTDTEWEFDDIQLVDPGALSEHASTMANLDKALVYIPPGGEDFDEHLPARAPAESTTFVDPFLMKQMFDTVTQCYEGKKKDAVIQIKFYPDTNTIEVLQVDQGLRAVARSSVPL